MSHTVNDTVSSGKRSLMEVRNSGGMDGLGVKLEAKTRVLSDRVLQDVPLLEWHHGPFVSYGPTATKRFRALGDMVLVEPTYKLLHSHDCTVCGTNFQHSHSIKELSEAKYFRQWCPDCLRFAGVGNDIREDHKSQGGSLWEAHSTSH